jgi:hypothetical protein
MTDTMWRTPIAVTPGPDPDGSGEDASALRALADLLSLADLATELSEQAYHHLAARPTVGAHLGRAREHLIELRRTLGKAEAMLAFNSGRRGMW